MGTETEEEKFGYRWFTLNQLFIVSSVEAINYVGMYRFDQFRIVKEKNKLCKLKHTVI